MDLQLYIAVLLWLVTLTECVTEEELCLKNKTKTKVKRHLINSFFDTNSIEDPDSLINNRHSLSDFFHRKFFNNHHHDEEGPLRLSIPEPALDHHSHYVVIKKHKPKIVEEEVPYGPVIRTVTYFREPQGLVHPTHIASSDIRKSNIVFKKGVAYPVDYKSENDHNEDQFKKPTKFSDPTASFSQRVETIDRSMPNRKLENAQFRRLPHFDTSFAFRDKTSSNFGSNFNQQGLIKTVGPRLPVPQRNTHFSAPTNNGNFLRPQHSNFGQASQPFFSQHLNFPPTGSNNENTQGNFGGRTQQFFQQNNVANKVPTARLPNLIKNNKFSSSPNRNENFQFNSHFPNIGTNSPTAQLPNFFNNPSVNDNFQQNTQFSQTDTTSNVPTARLPALQKNSKFSNGNIKHNFKFEDSHKPSNPVTNTNSLALNGNNQHSFNNFHNNEKFETNLPPTNTHSFNHNNENSQIKNIKPKNSNRNSLFNNDVFFSLPHYIRFQSFKRPGASIPNFDSRTNRKPTPSTNSQNLSPNKQSQNAGAANTLSNKKSTFNSLPHFDRVVPSFTAHTRPNNVVSNKIPNNVVSNKVVENAAFLPKLQPAFLFNRRVSTFNNQKLSDTRPAESIHTSQNFNVRPTEHFNNQQTNTGNKDEDNDDTSSSEDDGSDSHSNFGTKNIFRTESLNIEPIMNSQFSNKISHFKMSPNEFNWRKNLKDEKSLTAENVHFVMNNVRKQMDQMFRKKQNQFKQVFENNDINSNSFFKLPKNNVVNSNTDDSRGNNLDFNAMMHKSIFTSEIGGRRLPKFQATNFQVGNFPQEVKKIKHKTSDQDRSGQNNFVNTDDSNGSNFNFNNVHKSQVGDRRLPKFQATDFQAGSSGGFVENKPIKHHKKPMKKVLAKVIKTKINGDNRRRKQPISDNIINKPEHFNHFVENEHQGKEILSTFNSDFGRKIKDSVADFPLDPHNIFDKNNLQLTNSYGDNIQF